MPGLQEMLVIGVVALLVFGPDRLPEVARNVGKFVGKLRSETERNMSELKNLSEIRDLQRELQALRSDLNGVTRDVKAPLRGLSGSSPTGGAQRMQPTDLQGGRAKTPTESSQGSTVESGPPPIDPDAT